jgi:hypothetical protein
MTTSFGGDACGTSRSQMRMLAECKHDLLDLATLFGIINRPASSLFFCPVSQSLSGRMGNYEQRVEGL